MCHTYSVQRKTKRWPLAYFMNLLNVGGLNSYITRNPQWCQKLSHKQRQFLKDLGLDLVKPMIKRRAIFFVGLAKPIQQAMFVCGIAPAASVDYSQDDQGPTKSKRKRCYRSTMDRKSARSCTKRKKTVCAHHSTKTEEIKCQPLY